MEKEIYKIGNIIYFILSILYKSELFRLIKSNLILDCLRLWCNGSIFASQAKGCGFESRQSLVEVKD